MRGWVRIQSQKKTKQENVSYTIKSKLYFSSGYYYFFMVDIFFFNFLRTDLEILRQ